MQINFFPLFHAIISDDQLMHVTTLSLVCRNKMFSLITFVIFFFNIAFASVIHYQPEAVHLSYGGKFYYIDI